MEDNQPKKAEANSVDPDNLRVEYEALSNFYSTTISFRLTLLGFYLATIGLISGGRWPMSVPVSLLGVLITGALYLFELRTRMVFHNLAKRGIEIEQNDWDFKHRGQAPFFSRQFPEYLTRYGASFKDNDFASRAKILKIVPIHWATHSLALDILYLGILIFFIISIVMVTFE